MRNQLNCRGNCPHNFGCGVCFTEGREPGITNIKRHSAKLFQKIRGGVGRKPTIRVVNETTVELGNGYFQLSMGRLERK